MKVIIALFLFSLVVFAEDNNIGTLLQMYQNESELSKITKKDSAGFVQIYTRRDLERMQARTLGDVFETLTNLIYSRTVNYAGIFEYPTQAYTPLSIFRLYINDHDVTSASFGSALLIWSDMPISDIDHIEIYSNSSSIEFGNEAGSVIIKLYTKKISREEGGKISVRLDNKGSYSTDAYVAHVVNSDLSYMFYINKKNINRTKYYYQNHTINSDKNSYSLFTNILYKNYEINIMRYVKNTGNFLGKANIVSPTKLEYLPNDGNLHAEQSYIHIKRKSKNNINMEFSYDNFLYDRFYKATTYYYAGNAGLVKNYHTKYLDNIFSIKLYKKFKYKKNTFTLGSFYKFKKVKITGKFDSKYTESNNYFGLYSIYGEYRYLYDRNTLFITSLREDFYRYEKAVSKKNKWIGKIGLIKNINKFQIKAFISKNYYALPFYLLYNADDIPFKANPLLKYPDLYIGSLGISYRYKKNKFDLKLSSSRLKNQVIPPLKNDSKIIYYKTYNFIYTYKDLNNKIVLNLFEGANKENIIQSPKYGADIRVFNTINKFDIYNELNFKSSYENDFISLKQSYNWTFAVKYHITPNLYFGIRFENILNKGFKQTYRFFPYAIPVYDKKIWFNMGYVF